MQELWYVAYGSNMSLGRFRYYLLGGSPDGSTRVYPGCRDPAEPKSAIGLMIPGAVYFAGRSSVWGGGMALYDAHGSGRVAARAYRLSAEQFVDVLAQEMRQTPGTDLDLSPLQSSGHHSYGPGRYETLIRVGSRRGLPMVTFTSGAQAVRDLSAPSAAYLRTMITGLRESHGWSGQQSGRYLAGLPGAAGVWSRSQIEELAA